MTGRRLALVVANEEYDHEGLSRLRSPAADATALADVLGDSTIADFEVTVVHNEPAYVVAARIEDLFTDSKPDDLLLLHFSCHGLKDEAGSLYFAARNTRPDRLGSTAVAADFVQRCMRGSRARQMVLFLDCCYGGAFAQGVAVRASGSANVLEAFPARPLGGGRGRAVISASSAMQYAFEGAELAEDQQQPSVFTAALVQGLRTGEADRDEDGRISLSELYDYLFDKVQEQNPNQTPTRDFELQGELYLAHSRRRKVAAAALPRELADALHDQSMFARMGAVGELRSRLASTDLATALGAHGALTEVARNDIRYVADAAAEALAAATITPSEVSLDFGVLHAGEARVRRIRLSGPVVARSCTATASEDWIQVTEVSEVSEVTEVTAAGQSAGAARATPAGFDVSVRAGAVAGTHRGAVTFEGPAGRVAVPVLVEVQALGSTSPAVESAVTGLAVPGDAVPEKAAADEAAREVALPEVAVPEAVVPRHVVAEEAVKDTAPATPRTRPSTAMTADPGPGVTGPSVSGTTVAEPDATSEAESPAGVAPPAAEEAGRSGTPATAPAGPSPPRDEPGPRAGWLATAGGLLTLLSLALPFRYDTAIMQVPLTAAGHFGKYLALLGVLAVVSGVSAALRRGARPPALGTVVGAASAACWGLAFLVGVLEGGTDGYQAGYLAALAALVLIIAAGVLAMVDVKSAGSSDPARPRADALGRAIVLAGGVGAAVIGVQGTYLVAEHGVIGLLGLWAAALSVVVPFVAVRLRSSGAAAGLAAGWVVGGLGVAGAYVGLLPDAGDADRTRLVVFGATLLAVGVFAALRTLRWRQESAGTALGMLAAGAGLIGGSLLLLSLACSFRYDGSVWVAAADLVLVLPVTGAAALAGGVVVLARRSAAPDGAGLLLPAGAAGTWLLSTYLGRALDNDMQGYEVGWDLGLAAAALLVVAALCTAADLARARPPLLRRPALRQRPTMLLVAAALAGAACLVIQAAMLGSNGGTTWFVLETLLVAGLAFVLPLVGVSVGASRLSLGIILGWVGVAAGILVHYLQVLGNEGQSTAWIYLCALSLVAMAGTATVLKGRFADAAHV